MRENGDSNLRIEAIEGTSFVLPRQSRPALWRFWEAEKKEKKRSPSLR